MDNNRVEEAATAYAKNQTKHFLPPNYKTDFKYGAEWAASLPTNSMQWVSIKDEMPEMHNGWSKERVLAFDGSVMKVVNLYPTGLGILGYNTQQADYMHHITHWMPLPSAPQTVNTSTVTK